MRKRHEFSKSSKSLYAKALKHQITIRLNAVAVEYLKESAANQAGPIRISLTLFLRECAMQKRRPAIHWPTDPPEP